ncbi:MAG: hypothetical protein WCK39_03415, partial [Methanomassiliicoccales archaeon]
TLSAALCLLRSRNGRVLAIDQDSQQNLAFSLGYPRHLAGKLVPITQDCGYVEEKTGSRPGSSGGLMRLNPDVSDVAERFGVHIAPNLDLLVMGGVAHASSGCLCAENALLASMIRYLECRDEDLVVMDTQAGLEPFGRGIAEGFRCALVVTDATSNSMQVAQRVGQLSKDLGIEKVILVANRCDPSSERKLQPLIASGLFDSVHRLPVDASIIGHEPDLTPVIAEGGAYVKGVEGLLKTMTQ